VLNLGHHLAFFDFAHEQVVVNGIGKGIYICRYNLLVALFVIFLDAMYGHLFTDEK